MLWIKTVVHTTTAGIEPVSGILLLNGINGYEVCDSEDFNSFLENKEVYFDYIEDDLLKLKDCETTVTFYVPENSQGLETILGVKNALAGLKERDSENAFGTLAVDTDTRLEEEDWENNWKQYFKPFPVGERLMIKPSWETLPEGTNRTVVEIDPSSSFGTGSHTTTRLCLEEIDKTLAGMAEPSKIYMLDMGCGSGILGIAAIKLGAGHVNAVDIDQNSARIAAENYKVNGIDSTQYNVYAGDILKDTALAETVGERPYDLIAANIVADVIIGLAPVLPHFLNESSTLICSGILDTRLSDVLDALTAAGLTVTATKAKDDWRCVTAIRKYI